MIAGERRHDPVWAALQALIADYEDLQLDHTQVNIDIENVCDQAHFLADMMLEYDWEDSKWPYQLEVAQHVDTVRQEMNSLLDWPKKRDYLVSLRSYPSQKKKKENYTKQSSCSAPNGMISSKSLPTESQHIGIQKR